jgi:heme-degrading monooxygenase HmoA
VVRALLEMRVRPGDEDAFIAAWAEVARLAALAPGNLRQMLLRDPGDGARFLVSTDWASIGSFQAFERSPGQEVATAPLRALRESASMSIFEVVTAFEGTIRNPDS